MKKFKLAEITECECEECSLFIGVDLVSWNPQVPLRTHWPELSHMFIPKPIMLKDNGVTLIGWDSIRDHPLGMEALFPWTHTCLDLNQMESS